MNETDDLGFEFKVRKDGVVEVSRRGRLVGRIGGKRAESFLARAERAGPGEIQQLLARLTGKYKRGNERPGRDRDVG